MIFSVESLHDLLVEKFHDFFLGGQVVDFFVVERLRDFACGEVV